MSLVCAHTTGGEGGEGYVQVDQAPVSTWVCSYVHEGERCVCGGGGGRWGGG